MKHYILLLLILFSPLAFGSSAINPANTGNLGGVQFSADTTFVPVIDGMSTIATSKVRWHREGRYMVITGGGTAVSPAASALALTIPDGQQIDTTDVTTNVTSFGTIQGLFTTSTWSGAGFTMSGFYDGSSTTKVFFGYAAGGGTGYLKGNANDLTTNGNFFNFNLKIPISGWGVGGSSPARTVSVHHVSDWSAASGWGSTDTAVVKMSGSAVIQQATGSGITYANTSTDGATWTVATGHSGICAMNGTIQGANAYNIGAVITKNADATTQATNVDSLGSAQAAYIVAHTVVTGSAARGTSGHVSWRGPCTAGDVFRLQGINGVTRDMSLVYFTLEE